MSHQLILTPGGAAELRRGDEVLWNSADDESFRDEFTDDLLNEDDLPEILDYLIDEDYLTEAEADRVECIEEDLDGESEDAEAEDDRLEDHWPDED